MTERTGYIDVAEINGIIFSDSKLEDLLIYTETTSQGILLGSLMSNVSTLSLRSNISAFSGKVGIGSSNPLVSLEVNSTDALLLPKGTTGERPSNPEQGYVRYNTSINTFEGYGAGNAWGSLGGVKDTNQDTYISAESYPTSNDDALIFYNSNIETMRLTKEGNLGIGTSNPQYKLDIAGGINATSLLVNGSPLSVNVGGGFTTTSNNAAYTMCNMYVGYSSNLKHVNPYKLDVAGDINFTGRLFKSGFEFLTGGISSNSIVTSFQVAPAMKTFSITSSEPQTVFTLDLDGTLSANPTHAQVVLNGFKLAYINSSNNDFTLDITNPTPYTTRFTVTLVSPAVYGDVVDIAVWPYLPDTNGVYLTNIDFASNIMFSNVGIGISNPQHPLHIVNPASSNWLTSLQNGKVQTYISHSDGRGIKVIGSNSPGHLAIVECINDSNLLLQVRNDGKIGIGKSNDGTYALDVGGIVNATGLLINGAPLDVNIGGGFQSSNTTQTFTFCNVGIGKSNPQYSLDVAGQINASGLLINGDPLSTSIGGGFIASNNNTVTYCNVGINTSNPQYALDINGTINATTLLLNGQVPSKDIGGGFQSSNSTQTFTFCNVGIGKSNPQYTLDVNGTINVSNILINGAEMNKDIGGGFISTSNNRTFTLCNINIGDSNASTYLMNVEGRSRIKDGIVISNSNALPYISMLKDTITSGPWNGLGSWGMFQDSNSLLLSTSYNASNYIKLVSHCNDSSIAKTALSIDTSNARVGVGKNPFYELDVIGDINFTGRILQNGFEFITGPISSNNYVSSFQVVPVSQTFPITTSTGQSNFELTTQGTYLVDPQRAQVILNGSKLAYVDSNNKDYTVTVTNPTPYTTKFTTTLITPALYGDVVDITIWPYFEDLNGVYLTNIDFASNIMFSNVGIGISNPQHPFHIVNPGSSNWLANIKNGQVQTLVSHSDGRGIKVIGSNSPVFLPILECINDNNLLLQVRNDGKIGIGKSNDGTYSLDVGGIVNATGLLINGAPLDVNIGGGFQSSNTTQTFTFCNVGIGKSNPQYSLDVAGQINASGLLINGDPLSTSIGGGFIASNNNTVTYCNVGINTSNPQYALDINGTINATALLLNGQVPSKDVGGGFQASNSTQTFTYCNVGINTSNPQYTLDVNGTINVSNILINGAEINKDVGGGFRALSNNRTFTLCNLNIGDSNASIHTLNVEGRSRIKDGVVIQSSNSLPYISMLKDTFTAGKWDGLGTWGMLQDSNSLLLSTSYSTSNYIKLVSHCNNSSIAKTALSIDTSNARVGVGKNPFYELDVIGDINFTGRILQNGFEFITGPITSNDFVSSFQVVPVSQTFSISTQEGQSNFELITGGSYLANPAKAQVVLNGSKLAYIDSNNKDYTVTVTNPTEYNTKFTVSLITPAVYGDVVDITIWPYVEDLNGVFLKSIDFTSNITFSNVGIGKSNPQYPFHAVNQGSSNWMMGLENGKIKTYLSHSDGKGIRIEASNVVGNTPSLECLNGSNILFYIGNNGLVGIGTSNLTTEYALQVNGAINASGSVTSSSDIRLKTNIKKIENAVDKVLSISGYTFNFKNEINKQQIGLIAQEVEDILPELVTEDHDGLKSVAYGNMVALLIEAIKEQQSMIECLKKRLDDISS